MLATVFAIHSSNWWSDGHRLELLVLLAPAIGGILDLSYVVCVGGDFMHARMLLPGFFTVFGAFWVRQPSRSKDSYSLVTISVVIWSLVCLLFLRFTPVNYFPNGIANERLYYVNYSHVAHPITTRDYSETPWAVEGRQLAKEAASSSKYGRRMTLEQQGVGVAGPYVPVRSSLPEVLYAGLENVGIAGLAAGDSVYVFDELSLANPVGSHFTVIGRGRPGHEKLVSPLWMLARFGEPPTTNVPSWTSIQQVKAARSALACQPLSGYLRAITSPLSLGQVIDNFEHSLTWTSMSFSSDPIAAKRQLCGRGQPIH